MGKPHTHKGLIDGGVMSGELAPLQSILDSNRTSLYGLNLHFYNNTSGLPMIHVFAHFWINQEAAEARATTPLHKPAGDITETTSYILYCL